QLLERPGLAGRRTIETVLRRLGLAVREGILAGAIADGGEDPAALGARLAAGRLDHDVGHEVGELTPPVADFAGARTGGKPYVREVAARVARSVQPLAGRDVHDVPVRRVRR